MTKEYGLDLSYHNGTVDFSKVKSANSFVILRAGYGVNGTEDTKFEEYYKKAKAAGLSVGAYYYSYALTEAQALTEAKAFAKILKGKNFEYPIVLDMEDADGYKSKHGMPSNAMLVKICTKFCEYMEGQGYFVCVYASESWFNNQLKNLSDDYTKWVAKWGTNNGNLQSDVSSKYLLHQFTSKYKLNGSTFDRDVSYYDYKTLIKKKGFNGFTASSTSSSSSSVSYYTKCASSYKSIVDALKSIKVDSSIIHRKKIAKANGISNYSGSSKDNTTMLSLLKNGKLKKA